MLFDVLDFTIAITVRLPIHDRNGNKWRIISVPFNP